MAKEQQNEHEFIVTAVELGDSRAVDGVAIALTDARGGRVRLHLSSDMAERLREKVSAALDKTEGP
jgi:hypothetical protein